MMNFLKTHWKEIVVVVLVFVVGIIVGTKHSITAPRVFYSLDNKQNDKEIINVINGAHKYIYFAIYEFTKDNIAQALIAAKEKGIDVEGITDRDNAASASEALIVKELQAAGVNIEVQKHDPGIMHIKAVVTENEYASGSYNWTSSATLVNDEVLEVGTDENTREQYENILKKILVANATSAGVPAYEDLSEAPAVAGTPAEVAIAIDYTDAKNHIGEMAKVSGVVKKVYTSSSGQVFFDYCSNYKNCPFSAIIFADEAKNFTNLLSYQGKNIVVTGLIKEYQNTPEIEIDSPSDISLK